MTGTDQTWGDSESVGADYDATVGVYKTLVDVRFKLLAFVPTVTTVAVGIVAIDSDRPTPDRWLAVGLIGLIATLALVVYEIRNSLLHDCAIHRIKHLEQLRGFRPSSARSPARGVFGERPTSGRLLGVFGIKHDRALAMVYGVVAGAWAWVVLVGIEAQWDVPRIGGWVATLVKIVVPLIAGLLIAEEIARLSARDRPAGLIYTLRRGHSKFDAKAEADAIVEALEAACRTLPAKNLETWIDQVRALAAVGALVHRTDCHEPHSCEGCKQCAKTVVEWMNALGLIKYRQVWWFWLWCPTSGGRERARSRRVRPFLSDGAAEAPHVRIDAIRYGIVGADETQLVRERGGSIADVCDILNRRFGHDVPWADEWEISVRASLLERASLVP